MSAVKVQPDSSPFADFILTAACTPPRSFRDPRLARGKPRLFTKMVERYTELTMKRLDEIDLKHAERSAILEAARLLRERFPVEHIILFGSKARGEGDDESDLDLLILTQRLLSTREKEELTHALFPVELRWNVIISRIIIPVEAWERGPYQVLPIRHEVERDGVAA
jgi:uncharacterized protein